MANTGNSHPRTIEECNLVANAFAAELAIRVKSDSKVLIHGQEDLLTLSEYEALFKADMKICEATLDVMLCLARKQKAYLEAALVVKQLEKSFPEAISNTFEELSVQMNNAKVLRKRVVEGDFSFFMDANAVKTNTGPSIIDTKDSYKATVSHAISTNAEDAHCSGHSGSHTLFNRMRFDPVCSVPSVSSYPIRERPQFSSDVARRILEEMEKMEQKVELPKSLTRQHNSDHDLLYKGSSADRQLDENITGKRIQSSGGSNIDGSLIMGDTDESDQNGIRIYSPITRVPSQPNFDETGMEFLCEQLPIPKVLSEIQKCPIGKAYHEIIRPEPLRATNHAEVALKSTENIQRKIGDGVKKDERSDPTWMFPMKTIAREKAAIFLHRTYNKN